MSPKIWKVKRIPAIGLASIVVLVAALILLQYWNAKSVQDSLKNLKSSADVQSVQLLVEGKTGSMLYKSKLRQSQIDELLSVMAHSHSPWRKEKKLYDYTYIANIVTNAGTRLRITLFVDVNSDIVNYQVANRFGVQTFWAHANYSLVSKL